MEPDVHELSAGYALDALDPGEREAFELHLAGCEACRRDVAEFWDVAGALALSAGGPAPPPGLRERILADARAEKQTVVPFEPRRRRIPALGVVAAIAAVVAIGVGIYAVSLGSQLDKTRQALARQESAAGVLADPAATTVALESGTGKLVVGTSGAVLVLDDLAPAPDGKTYQAWVVDGGTPESAGVFDARAGQAVVPIGTAVPPGAVVAVTIEQGGGATSPTLPPVAASKPV
jgi:anti-sigma factor RsiW